MHTYGKKFYIIIDGSVSVQVQVNKNYETSMVTVAQLTTGMSFGELALIKDQARAASILCNTNCHFAVLCKEDYMNIIGKIQARKLDDFIEFLHNIPMLKNWTKKNLEVLTYHFKTVSYKRKQVVFQCNSTPQFVYIVKNGEFEIMKKVVNKNFQGAEQAFFAKIALLGAGEVFCDEEVIGNCQVLYTCICYSTVGELLCISAEDFLMKFQQEELIQEFKVKTLSKSGIREGRLKNFQEYLRLGSFLDNKIHIKKRSFSPVQAAQKRFPSKTPEVCKGVPLLTLEKIEKIKVKAMGRINSPKTYMQITSRRESGSVEGVPLFYQIKGRNSLSSQMKWHRPGGYHDGHLKKSSIGYRSINYS